MSENTTDTNAFAKIACRLDPMFERALRAEQLAESNGKLAHDAAIKVHDLERQLAESRRLFESSKKARQSLSDACDHLHRQLAEVRRQLAESDAAHKATCEIMERHAAISNGYREQRDRLAEALRITRARVNRAAQAGKVWVKYPREWIDAIMTETAQALATLERKEEG